MWRKGNRSALLVGMQTGAATVENSMEFPQNISIVMLSIGRQMLSDSLKYTIWAKEGIRVEL